MRDIAEIRADLDVAHRARMAGHNNLKAETDPDARARIKQTIAYHSWLYAQAKYQLYKATARAQAL